MSKTLELTLFANDIKQAIKSDTYITGQIDKSADMVKNAALAYNEQAGDEDYHNVKIYRTMKGALAKFEAQLTEYVETSSSNAQIYDNLNGTTTNQFKIFITVGSRLSGAFTNPLAYLAQEYIINTALYYWWQPIKPSLAKDYLGFAADNLADVRRCLAKSAPSSDNTTYDDISGRVLEQSYITFTQDEYTMALGSPEQPPRPTVYPSDADLSWSSSNESVATVSSLGVVTYVAAGNTVITASYEGDEEYTSCSGSYTLHVTAH